MTETDISAVVLPTVNADCERYGHVVACATKDAVWITHDWSTGPGADECHNDMFGITDPAVVLRFAYDLIAALEEMETRRSRRRESLRKAKASIKIGIWRITDGTE